MKRADYAGGLATVVAYIRGHLNEPLQLAHLAALANFSQFHFHRVFRAVVGEPLGTYVRRERLQRAALELRSGHRDVTAIALEAGYETHSAFTRAFTDHFGLPPSQFRADESIPVVPQHALPRFRGEPMNVRTIVLPPRRLLALRHVGSYRKAGDAFTQLRSIATERRLVTAGAAYLGLSYDDPDAVGEDLLRFDACVASTADASDPLRVIEHGGGRHAVYRHKGPYQLLEHVFDRMFDAVVFSGSYELRDAPCVEIYLNDPLITPQGELQTDVCIPVH